MIPEQLKITPMESLEKMEVGIDSMNQENITSKWYLHVYRTDAQFSERQKLCLQTEWVSWVHWFFGRVSTLIHS